MENLKVPTTNLDDIHDTPRFSQTSQIDSTIHLIHEVSPKKENNLNQTTEKKKEFNFFACSCCKNKSKKYKSQKTDESASITINTKIKIKNSDESDIYKAISMIRKNKSKKYKSQETEEPAPINTIFKIKNFDESETYKEPKMMIRKTSKKYKSPETEEPARIKIKEFMIRKTSSPTQIVSSPIMLTRRFSEESVKSAVFLSRKSSAESVKSPTLLIRKSSAPCRDQNEICKEPKMMIRKHSAPSQSVSSPIHLTRKFSEESVKSADFSSAESVKSSKLLIRKSSDPSNNFSTQSNKSENLLGRKCSAKRNEIVENEKANNTLEEEANEYVDISSFEIENVLCYVCLQENVENCQKCITLNHIFETQTFEENYLLYNLHLHEVYNPNQHDLEILPIWLELLLSSILAEQQDMTFSITTANNENGPTKNYRSKLRYAKLLTQCAQIRPLGGHLFLSILKSKFLQKKDLSFFLNNDIITDEDDIMWIGDKEGLQVFGNDKFENIFLFDGIMEEVKKHRYKPTVGDVVYSNVNLYACTEDQFDILKNASMKVEKIDSKTGWILVSDMIYDKRQWISPEDFMHIFSGFENMISEIKEPTSEEHQYI